MPTDNERHGQSSRDDEVPRWAATAGRRRFRAPRWAVRLVCSPRRRRPRDTSAGKASAAGVAWPIHDRTLGEHHTFNFAQARRAFEEMVRAGFNTGAVPYGYRAHRTRVAPVGARPRWRTRLVIEPVEAATVRIIFMWRGRDGLGIAAIHQCLVAARYPEPLPETGQPGAWTPAIIKAILRNPKYLGRQVWGRTHHGRRAPSEEWVWSPVWAHPPIISDAEFVAANRRSWLATALPASASGRDDTAAGAATTPNGKAA